MDSVAAVVTAMLKQGKGLIFVANAMAGFIAARSGDTVPASIFFLVAGFALHAIFAGWVESRGQRKAAKKAEVKKAYTTKADQL